MQRFDTSVTTNQKVYDSVCIGASGDISVIYSGSISANAVLTITGGTGNSLSFEGVSSAVRGEYWINEIRGVDVYDSNFYLYFSSGTIAVKNTTYDLVSRATIGGHATGIRTSGKMTVQGDFGGAVIADGGVEADDSGVMEPLVSSPKVYGINTGDFYVTGKFSGSITVLNGAAEAKGITASSVTFGDDFSGTISVKGVSSVFAISSRNAVTAGTFTSEALLESVGNVVSGIDGSALSLDNFSGICRVVGTGKYPRPYSGSSSGFSARTGNIEINSFSGVLSVSNSITSYGFSAPGMISGTGGSTAITIEENGIIAVFSTLADSSVYGMTAAGINLTCEGTVFAGYLGSDYYLQNDVVVAMLEDYRVNRSSSEYAGLLTGAAVSADASIYAIRLSQTGSAGVSANTLNLASSAIVFGNVELFRTAGGAASSTVTVASGAEIFGSISTGNADDSISMYAGAMVSGNLNSGLGNDVLNLYGDQSGDGRSGVIGGNITSLKNIVVYGGEWIVSGTISGYSAVSGGVQSLVIETGAVFAAGNFAGQTVSGGGTLKINGIGNSVAFSDFNGSLILGKDAGMTLNSYSNTLIDSICFDITGGRDTSDVVSVDGWGGLEVNKIYCLNGGNYISIELGTVNIFDDVYYKAVVEDGDLHFKSAVKNEQFFISGTDSADAGFHSDVLGTASDGVVQLNVSSGEILRAFYGAGGGAEDVTTARITLSGGEYSGAQLYGGMYSNGTSGVAKNIVFTVAVDNEASRIIGGGVAADYGDKELVTDSILLNIKANCSEQSWIYGSARVEGTASTLVSVGSVSVQVDAATRIGNLVGGGRVGNANGSLSNNNTEILITSSTVSGSVFAGAYVYLGSAAVNGTCTVDISGNSVVNGGVFGGGVVSPSDGSGRERKLVIQNSRINITGSTVQGNGIFGGGYVAGAGAYETVENSVINLNSGAVAGFCVFGGGFAAGGGSSAVGNVSITIDGASVKYGDIFCGGYVFSSGGTATVGNVELVVKSTANVETNIYAGGCALSTGADISVDSSRIIFEGVNPFNGNVYGNGYGLSSDNVGFSQVQFRSYEGNFAGNIDSAFNDISFTVGSSSVSGVVFTGNSGLLSSALDNIGVDTSQVTYSSGADLGVFDLTSGVIDFSILTLDGAAVSEDNSPTAGSWSLVWSETESGLRLAGYDKALAYKEDDNYRVFCLA